MGPEKARAYVGSWFEKCGVSLAYWYMSVIPDFGRLRLSPASLCYIARPCLKKKSEREQGECLQQSACLASVSSSQKNKTKQNRERAAKHLPSKP
jgi:hypothetical protein